MEDEPGQISASGRTDLYEARRMTRQQWIIAGVLITIILTGNLGGIIWALNW